MNMVPCPGCTRHVRSADTDCPFCGEALPLALRQQRRVLPNARLGRAATFAFGAAMAVTTASGCDDTSPADAGVDAGSEVDSGGVAPAYGAPAPDAGPPMEDAGSAALYGGAPGD